MKELLLRPPHEEPFEQISVIFSQIVLLQLVESPLNFDSLSKLEQVLLAIQESYRIV